MHHECGRPWSEVMDPENAEDRRLSRVHRACVQDGCQQAIADVPGQAAGLGGSRHPREPDQQPDYGDRQADLGDARLGGERAD